MSAFQTPAVPGYSPWFSSRQDSPFLRTPGAQGLQEGVAGGQGQAFTPSQEFFSGGTEGTAPPSSIPPNPDMWGRFGGSGGAPSSFAQSQPGATGTAPAVPTPMPSAPAQNGMSPPSIGAAPASPALNLPQWGPAGPNPGWGNSMPNGNFTGAGSNGSPYMSALAALSGGGNAGK